jgi:heterodisulfide reductase subunit B
MVTKLSTDLANRIKQATGENVFLCYHCVKCTSGCPLMEHFDLSPNQIMRAAQLGMEDLIFESKSPWLCSSCQTCTTRCPQGIDIAKVMDFIVGEAMKAGIEPPIPEVALFNKVFLRDVDILGRSYELGLMAELNVRTRKLFKDMDLGLEMLKHRKLKFLPEIVRKKHHRKPIAPTSRPPSEIGYYPGCSLHGMEEEFDLTTRAVLEKLEYQPVEPEGWICCGSTPAHRVDHKVATRLPLESLILYEQNGLSELTLPCASCFSRFRAAARNLRLDPELKGQLTQEIGYDYQDSIEIYSLVDFINERVGLDRVSEKVVRPLSGLKVACYYGCLLTRPPEITGVDPSEAEYPMSMDRIMKALGATPIDWDYKVTCCGAALSLTQTPIVLEMSRAILENAKIRGADVVVSACPLCHLNLDGRQSQMDPGPEMPALYFTQLMSLAFGMPDKAALERNLIDCKPALKEKGLI